MTPARGIRDPMGTCSSLDKKKLQNSIIWLQKEKTTGTKTVKTIDSWKDYRR